MNNEENQEPTKVCEECGADCDMEAEECSKCGAPFDQNYTIVRLTPEMQAKAKRSARINGTIYIIVSFPIGVAIVIDGVNRLVEEFNSAEISALSLVVWAAYSAVGIFMIATGVKLALKLFQPDQKQ